MGLKVYSLEGLEYILIPTFFIISTLYSMVGFGGGSSYIAFLMFFNISFTIAPSVSLVCNILVVAGGSFNFYKNKLIDYKFFLPLIISSVPLAYLGGSIEISKNYFQLILGIALLVSALKMVFVDRSKFTYQQFIQHPPAISLLLVGSFLGFLSGLVGIGGGIFLSPLLYFLKWGNPRKNAASACLFILVNSMSGLAGQFQKHLGANDVLSFLPLFITVVIGGQIGNWLCNYKISPRKIELYTSVLIFLVSFKLLYNSIF